MILNITPLVYNIIPGKYIFFLIGVLEKKSIFARLKLVYNAMKNKEYSIPFAGLKQGKHKFEYQIDNTFFESFDYHEFNDAAIKLHIVLDRMSTVLELEMKTKGTVNLYCDLTNEPFDQKIEASLKLLVKFGDRLQ